MSRIKKYHSRLITTDLLINLCNKDYYIPIYPINGHSFGVNCLVWIDCPKIKSRIFLKTIKTR